MKRLLIIFSFFMVLLAYTGHDTYGQLITDSDKKLKSQKKDKKDGGLFSIFKKKKGRSASGPLTQKKPGVTPRYSSGSPFAAFNKRKGQTPRSISSQRRNLFKDQRYTAPRYSSSGLAGVMSGKKKGAPRYSPGTPFTKKDKVVSPRYSSSKPFQKSPFAQLFSRSTGPRYSAGSPFTRKDRFVSPRYSGGMPFSRKQKSITPRYSPGSPFEQTFFSMLFDKRSGPRYSQGQPFSKADKAVTPRYSAGSPFEKSFLERLFSNEPQVRYSAGSPFTRKDKSITPRYSAGSPFSNKDKQVSPRYSAGDPFKQSLFARLFSAPTSPRYSAGSPFTDKDKQVSPRYSAGSPFDGMRWSWIKPRYSTAKNRFDVNERMKRQSRLYDFASAKYRGSDRKQNKWAFNADNLWSSSKTKRYEGNKVPRFDPRQNKDLVNYTGSYKQKSIDHKKMHPSANHLTANQDSEAMRDSMRKWNIFWTRLNRNKVQPDAVTDKISKPKFDRKEAKIWND